MTTCPECGTFRLWKYGFQKNKRGDFQRYRCKSCKRQFIDDDFLGMQTPKEVVAFAIRLWIKGLSPASIVEEMKFVYNLDRSESCIQFWVEKYLPLFEAINDMPLHGISRRLHWDYTYLKINGEDAYLWALKCPETKLVVGWTITTTRNIEDAKASLREAKRRFPVSYQIEEIVTDGEQSFPRAIWEVFDHEVEHYRYKGFVDKKNNNMIETLWRFKNNIPTFRSLEQARRFFTIWVAMYNMKKSRRVSESREVYELIRTTEIYPKTTIQVL
jgi:putative transposase